RTPIRASCLRIWDGFPLRQGRAMKPIATKTHQAETSSMAGHGHIEGSNRQIAILIAFLAALLAICEMGAKSAQTAVLAEHVEASNLWNFYQAKTIRQTILRTQSDAVEAQYKDGIAMPPVLAAQTAQ